MTAVFLIAFAYFVGSFPSGIVVGQAATGRDVRNTGSGNIGAANVARLAGFRIGVMVAALDILKGMVPVLLARGQGLGHVELAMVALAAVLGHDFSVFLRLRGGKGVATTLGVAIILAPLGTLIAAAIWIVVLLRSTITSLASLVALAMLPLTMALTGSSPAFVFLASALFILAAGKHWENVIRLVRGTEPGFRRRRASGA